MAVAVRLLYNDYDGIFTETSCLGREEDVVSADNCRGAVLLFLVALAHSNDWPRTVCISFGMLQEISHEIVWDWTSLYFNCHHFKSQPCQAVTAYTVEWVECSCMK